MTICNAPAGSGLKGSSLRRDDTPQERTIGDAALDLIRSSKCGLTNRELSEALDEPLKMVTDATYRLLTKGKLGINSPRPGDPLRYVLVTMTERVAA